jgi:hypothetical protein
MNASLSGSGPKGPGKLRLVVGMGLLAVLAAAGCGGSGSAPPAPSKDLSSYDTLAADTLDGGRWLTPEYVRTISGGKAHLSVRATDMRAFSVQGNVYTSRLSAVPAGGGRVTTLQAEVSVPAATAVRNGAATLSGAVRLRYQPPADRGLSFPGDSRNLLIAGLEVYDSGTGPVIRRRVSHCDDDACITAGTSGITLVDPESFTTIGVSATAPAAHDTAYTLTLSVDEGSSVFTWTVRGGAFGAGVSGTADVTTWLATAGMTLASGWSGAELAARTLDPGADGGSSGAVTATFDNVMLGTNGAAASLHDDFSGSPSSEATGFSLDRWSSGGAVVEASGGAVRLVGIATLGGASTAGYRLTSLTATYPTTYNTWQADVAITHSTPGGVGNLVRLGGAFLSDGTAGGAHDASGDIVSDVTLSTSSASYRILRCFTASCGVMSTIAQQALTPSAAHPLGLGTVHTVAVRWNPVSRVFTYRLDDATPVDVQFATSTVTGPPHVPSRYVRAEVLTPSGHPVGTTSSIEASVRNVVVAP